MRRAYVIVAALASACGYPNPGRSSDAGSGGDGRGQGDGGGTQGDGGTTGDGSSGCSGSKTFAYNAAPYTFTLPACVTAISVDLFASRKEHMWRTNAGSSTPDRPHSGTENGFLRASNCLANG